MNPQGMGGGQGPLGMMLTPWVKRLMIATGVLSVIGGVAMAWMHSPAPLYFVLEPAAVYGRGAVLPGIPAIWQLFTYPFFALEPLGLIFGLLLYGWFAGALEDWWGSKRFLRFFLIVSIGAAVLTTLLSLVWPALAGARIMGPYPVLEGLVIAWGLTFPRQSVYLFFVLPVQGIHLVYLTVGVVVVYILFSGQLAPFMPQIFGMALGAVIVTGVWKPRFLVLRWRKFKVERELEQERRRRKSRVSKADHLRVIDDEDNADDEDDGGPKPPRRGNGAPDGGWLN